MKKYRKRMLVLLTGVFLVSLSCNSFAREKLTLGVKGNVGLGNSSFGGVKSATNYNYGLQLNYYLLPFLGVETGFQLYKTGFTDRITLRDMYGEFISDVDLNYDYKYISVPVYLRVKLKKLYATAGINLTHNTDAEITEKNGVLPTGTNNDSYTLYVNDSNIDLHLGFGYQVMVLDRVGVFCELGYNHQLMDAAETSPQAKALKLYNFNFGGGICVSLINK